MPGVFAAGDVRPNPVKRVAAAVGDGSSAIREVHEYRLPEPVWRHRRLSARVAWVTRPGRRPAARPRSRSSRRRRPGRGSAARRRGRTRRSRRCRRIATREPRRWRRCRVSRRRTSPLPATSAMPTRTTNGRAARVRRAAATRERDRHADDAGDAGRQDRPGQRQVRRDPARRVEVDAEEQRATEGEQRGHVGADRRRVLRRVGGAAVDRREHDADRDQREDRERRAGDRVAGDDRQRRPDRPLGRDDRPDDADLAPPQRRVDEEQAAGVRDAGGRQVGRLASAQLDRWARRGR